MSNSLLEIPLDENISQRPSIDKISTGNYDTVSIVTNLAEPDDDLLQALDQTNAAIRLPLACYKNRYRVNCPTFGYTKKIGLYGKKQKKRHLNMRYASFSFSKFNADDLLGLSEWSSLQTLDLDYYFSYSDYSDAKEKSAEQKKNNENQFFKHLATLIAGNKSLVSLNLNNYSFKVRTAKKSEKTLKIEKILKVEKLGRADYFPYENYEESHPETSTESLDNATIALLRDALKNNYSLLDFNSEQEKQVNYNQILHDIGYNFIASILTRNRELAKQLRDAAASGFTNKVKELLDKGVSVYGTDESGNSALHLAAKNGCADCVRTLLVYRASWRAVNHDGKTPKQLALQNNRERVVELLENPTAPAKPVAPKVTFASKIASINANPQTQSPVSSLYPQLNPVGSTSPLKKTSAKKSCPFTSLVRFFKSQSSEKTGFSSAKTVMQNSVSVIEKPATPKLDRKAIAGKIAEDAINGAINGLEAINSNHSYDAFEKLIGLLKDTPFSDYDRAKVSKLIVRVLNTSMQPLENFDKIQLECLTRYLAAQLQRAVIDVDNNSTNCEEKIVIVNTVKDYEKINLLGVAIQTALTDAYHRMIARENSVPSAPPQETANTEQAETPLYPVIVPLVSPVPPVNPSYESRTSYTM